MADQTVETATGISQDPDTSSAVNEVVNQIKTQTIDPDMVLIFFTDNYDPEQFFALVKSHFRKFTGACVPGIISGSSVITSGIGAIAVQGTNLKAKTYLKKGLENNTYQIGEAIGENYRDCNSGTLFVFPDGFAPNISEMLRGLYNCLGSRFNYIGGGAGDNLRFIKTYQFTENGIASHSVATTLLQGIDFRLATDHGWIPKSAPITITKAEGKVVYEIDGIPAFQRYNEILGGIDKENFAFYGMKHPLGIPYLGDNFIIRDPLEVREDDSILFVTEVPQNTAAMVMEGEIEQLLNKVEEISVQLSKYEQNIVLVFDCVSRYLLMENEFTRELDIINEKFNSEIFGILTFGEVSSISEVPLFYNKTLAILAG